MAKKRKGHRRRGSQRRHVGAFGLKGKDTGLKLAALAGGFFLGDTINGQIDAIVSKILPAPATPTTTTTATTTSSTGSTIAMVAQLGLGGMLLMRKQGGGMGTALKVGGGLLAGAGIKRALKTMGVIKGYQSVPVIGRHRMAGYQSVPVIGRTYTPPQLAGRPAQLQGYRVNGYTPAGSGVMGSTIGAAEGSGLTNTGGGGLMS